MVGIFKSLFGFMCNRRNVDSVTKVSILEDWTLAESVIVMAPSLYRLPISQGKVFLTSGHLVPRNFHKPTYIILGDFTVLRFKKHQRTGYAFHMETRKSGSRRSVTTALNNIF